MRKALFTGSAALSLLICIATIVLWVRSYWIWDFIGHVQSPNAWQLESCSGQIAYRYARSWPVANGWFHFQQAPSANAPHSKSHFVYEMTNGFPLFGVPHWLAALMALVLPVCWYLALRRQHHRARTGLCLSCGYDLRASTERCPECGTAISSPSPAGRGPG